MKYLKRFNESESYSVFDTEGWKKFLPSELELITNNGKWILKLPMDENNLNHATNITNLMNNFQINYYQNTPSQNGGDVTADGEPDQLEFDIDIVKVNNGTDANPDNLRLNVDITYGDAMASSFSIEKPNKIKVTHYTGFGSKYDDKTCFGFEDGSIDNIVNFFNAWGYQLNKDNFRFLDKYLNSYVYEPTMESIKLKPNFNNKSILVIKNDKFNYITNYLNSRGIPYKVVNDQNEYENIKDEIIGIIALESKGIKLDLNAPILAIGNGLNLLNFNTNVKNDYEFFSKIEVKYPSHFLFKGINNINEMEFNINEDGEIGNYSGFSVLATLNDKPILISNDSKKQYATLINPDIKEDTYPILDNFIDICGEEKPKNIIERYSSFIKNK